MAKNEKEKKRPGSPSILWGSGSGLASPSVVFMAVVSHEITQGSMPKHNQANLDPGPGMRDSQGCLRTDQILFREYIFAERSRSFFFFFQFQGNQRVLLSPASKSSLTNNLRSLVSSWGQLRLIYWLTPASSWFLQTQAHFSFLNIGQPRQLGENFCFWKVFSRQEAQFANEWSRGWGLASEDFTGRDSDILSYLVSTRQDVPEASVSSKDDIN